MVPVVRLTGAVGQGWSGGKEHAGLLHCRGWKERTVRFCAMARLRTVIW